MYSSPTEHGQSREQRSDGKQSPGQYPVPVLHATGPNEVWTWDVIKLRGPEKRVVDQLADTPVLVTATDNSRSTNSGSRHPPVCDAYAAYTNQGFLGRETSETAIMLRDGSSEQDVRRRAVDENIFQLTSEASRKSTVGAVLARLDGASQQLLDVLASSDPDTRRLATLYVILLQHRLLREFIANVVVPKARLADEVVTGTDVAIFMQRVFSQQPDVDAWSTSTKQKAISNLLRILTDAGLLERMARDRHVVRSAWVPPELRHELEAAGRTSYLKLLLDQGGAA